LFIRRYKLLNIGLEILTTKHKSLYIIFQNTDERDAFYTALRKMVSD